MIVVFFQEWAVPRNWSEWAKRVFLSHKKAIYAEHDANTPLYIVAMQTPINVV